MFLFESEGLVVEEFKLAPLVFVWKVECCECVYGVQYWNVVVISR